ncbi:protein translocase subunit SecF [Thermithiobacillus plumbiphilus]|uniref:Protein-export membrane protein SecF n=1 Tax=Thermithiobacillus plumbiphilus TaxID=1729899 RepID=A0ABU9DAW4_9PROT
MEFFKRRTAIRFMEKRRHFAVFSLILIIVSLVSLATRGLNLGIDFTGGTLVEVRYERTVPVADVRAALTQQGFGDAVVQTFGGPQDVLIRLPGGQARDSATLSTRIAAALKQGAQGQDVQVRRVEFVGPQVGKELAQQGMLALVLVILGILIYVSFRFEWRFAIGSILALLHDPILVLGFFSVTGMEFSISTLAALLAVMGYSINDTVVVFDRIREYLVQQRNKSVEMIMNESINSTLSRTIMTSMTTLLVVLALLFFGGPVLEPFAATLVVGILVGTYSSIFIASPAALWLGLKREHVVKSKLIRGTDREDGARI